MVLETKKLIGESQTRTAMAAILELCLIGMEYGNLVQDIPYNFPIKYQFIVSPSFRGVDFKKRWRGVKVQNWHHILLKK